MHGNGYSHTQSVGMYITEHVHEGNMKISIKKFKEVPLFDPGIISITFLKIPPNQNTHTGLDR